MTETAKKCSPLEAEICAGAVSALRRRAASQAAKARAENRQDRERGGYPDWRGGDRGSSWAKHLAALADELEGEGLGHG